ncbi:MAG: response regulator, partial [Mariprofundaceae bacterium]|nr:response regulator [Mariprofundaceae bacterium]
SKKVEILFVEDAQFFRHLVIPVLESMNFSIRTAKDGQQACDILRNYTPDLILTDIEMPNMNGIELAKWVKEQPALHMIPVIALTGTKNKHIELENDMFEDVLVKLDRQSLVASLAKVLEKYQHQTPAEQATGKPSMPALSYT